MSSHPLRLVFPQWQGGANPLYHFGSHLLNYLAPPASGPVEFVSVTPPNEEPLQIENGVRARSALLDQTRHARSLIDLHKPDSLVVLGGDCLVDLAPFGYLAERYPDLAILWVDAHPDVMTPEQGTNAHAMVLGNLLGFGDPEFSSFVSRPVQGSHVMFAGLSEMSDYEREVIERYGVRRAEPSALVDSSAPVLDWLEQIGAKHVAVHFDLDVIDPATFRHLYFSDPLSAPHAFDGIPQGKLTFEQVARMIVDVSERVNVVGLGITEHLPWDAFALQRTLAKLPLL